MREIFTGNSIINQFIQVIPITFGIPFGIIYFII